MKLTSIIYLILGIAFTIFLSLSLFFFVKAYQYKTSLTPSANLPSPKYHFILIPEEIGNPYWKRVKNGADKAAKQVDATIEYAGPQQSNINEHIKFIDKAIASKVDGIITQGLNPSQMTSEINKAVKYGIPVITIDTDAPNSKRSAYVGTNNFEAGFKAGKALIKATGGKAHVALIVGNSISANQQARVRGFKAALKGQPNVKISDIEYSNISRIQASEKTYDIFKKHPNVNAFFGTSALDAIGITSVTKTLKSKNKPFIIGFDTLPETLEGIKEGSINETVAQEPFLMGYKSVKLMVELLEDKHIPKINYTDTKIIDKKNLASSTRSIRNGEITP